MDKHDKYWALVQMMVFGNKVICNDAGDYSPIYFNDGMIGCHTENSFESLPKDWLKSRNIDSMNWVLYPKPIPAKDVEIDFGNGICGRIEEIPNSRIIVADKHIIYLPHLEQPMRGDVAELLERQKAESSNVVS